MLQSNHINVKLNVKNVPIVQRHSSFSIASTLGALRMRPEQSRGVMAAADMYGAEAAIEACAAALESQLHSSNCIGDNL